MRYITDFHIHSRYSRATSKSLTPESLDYWSKLKGVHVLGTGDCVHPRWLEELKEKLQVGANGLYQLKSKYKLKPSEVPCPSFTKRNSHFMLTTEISSIYKKNGKVRKVHNLCVFPNFDVLDKVQKRLAKIGNIASDGRPILGLDAKHLLEIVLEASPEAYLIPAHIWTPWFAVLGSSSGFDSIEECFEELTPHIFALETGLSSDPHMNRTCSFLDKFRLVSNSDAHSNEKLGREANIFDTELSYKGIFEGLKYDRGFEGTIEFYPQEGKYHYDGHRQCNLKWTPLETIKNKGICSVCKKPVTKGVMYRIAQLADRKDIENLPLRQKFYSITSFPDVLAEIFEKRSAAQVVQKEYFRLLEKLGSDFEILLEREIADIRTAGGDLLAEAIRRLREGSVYIEQGYDGEFGRITAFHEKELQELKNNGLFKGNISKTSSKTKRENKTIQFDISAFQKLHKSMNNDTKISIE